MLKDFKIQKNRITLTCALPIDLETFESNRRTLVDEKLFHLERLTGYDRQPMQVKYEPSKDGDSKIVLSFKGKPEPIYYEDLEKLARLLNQKSPVTKDRIVNDEVLAKFLAKARETEAYRTEFYPDKHDPKAEVQTTEDGFFRIMLLPGHHNYLEGGGAQMVKKLNGIFGGAQFDTSVFFSSSNLDNNLQRLTQAANVLADHKIIEESQKSDFVRKTLKAQVKHFAIGEVVAGKRDNGGEHYAKIMATLSKTGDFRSLSADDLEKLQAIAHLNPFDSGGVYPWLRKEVNSDKRELELTAFCVSFLTDIEAAIASPETGVGHAERAVRARKGSAAGRG